MNRSFVQYQYLKYNIQNGIENFLYFDACVGSRRKSIMNISLNNLTERTMKIKQQKRRWKFIFILQKLVSMKEKIHSQDLQNQQSQILFKPKLFQSRGSTSPLCNEESIVSQRQNAISENHSKLKINQRNNSENKLGTEETINSIFSNLKHTIGKKQKKQLSVMFCQPNSKSQKGSIADKSKAWRKQVKNIKNASLLQKLSSSSKIYSAVSPQKIKNPAIQFLHSTTGIRLVFLYQVIHTIVSALITLALLIVLSIEIALSDLDNTSQFLALQIAALVALGLNICFNFFTVKKQRGRRIQLLNQIFKHYLTHSFAIDFLSFIVLLINISSSVEQIRYSMFIFIFKIQDFRRDISKLDYFFITNLYKQQYWRLVRLILFNFFVAHLIALVFLLMSNLDKQNNWLTKSNHNNDTQFDQYIWAYYWSVTTMLSVGFGDLVPANSKEAVCVIFVQTISCVALAYTISSVGDLLLNIRNQEIEKKRAFKIFKEIVEKNEVARGVQEKVHNYIEESIQIKKRFNFEEQKKFLQDLPPNVKTDLLFECNSKIFDCISLLNIKSYATESIKELAQKVQLFIAHPEQCIMQPTSRQIKILKQGKIGYFAHKNRFMDDKYLINELKIKSKQNPEMILNCFFSHNHLICNIKAINYSSIYKIKYQDFVECAKKSSVDFQMFCIQKDKHRKSIDQFQSITCEGCESKYHTKARCPKLHYIPYRASIMCSYLTQKKSAKTQRNSKFVRISSDNAMVNIKSIMNHPYRQFLRLQKQKQQNILNFDNTYTESQINSEELFQDLMTKGASLKTINFIMDDYVSQKCTLEIRINNQPENISRFKPSVNDKIRSTNNISPENSVRRRRLRTLKNQCQLVKDAIMNPNELLVQNSLNNKKDELARLGRCKIAQTLLQMPIQQTERLRSKSYIQPFEIEEMMGVDCDVAYDFSVYFPQNNAKCLKKSIKNNVGVKKLKKVGISQLEYTTDSKTLRLID